MNFQTSEDDIKRCGGKVINFDGCIHIQDIRGYWVATLIDPLTETWKHLFRGHFLINSRNV